jgi:hypothetical protein
MQRSTVMDIEMIKSQINRLIESDHKKLRELGWLLYNCNAHELGLSKDDVNHFLKILGESDLNRDIEDEIEKAYEEGYEDALREYGN